LLEKESAGMEWKGILIFLAAVAAWIFLMGYLLPKAGVPT
jgi:hypothetical protein